jgi:restriction system protein
MIKTGVDMADAETVTVSEEITDEQLLRYLQQMDEWDFEEFVADLWRRKGWDAEVDGGTNDRGVDVRATQSYPYEQKVLIQAKRYGPTTTVGSPDVQQYASLAHQEPGVDKVLIVTTNGFSSQAKEMARDLNVKTIDGTGLVHIIREEDALDLAAEYLPIAINDTADHSLEPGVEESDVETESSNLGRWRWVAGAVGASAIGLLFAIIGAGGPLDLLAGFALLVGWILTPIAIALDGRAVRRETDWSTWWPLYALGSLIPLMGLFLGAAYLARRYDLVGFDD